MDKKWLEKYEAKWDRYLIKEYFSHKDKLEAYASGYFDEDKTTGRMVRDMDKKWLKKYEAEWDRYLTKVYFGDKDESEAYASGYCNEDKTTGRMVKTNRESAGTESYADPVDYPEESVDSSETVTETTTSLPDEEPSSKKQRT